MGMLSVESAHLLFSPQIWTDYNAYFSYSKNCWVREMLSFLGIIKKNGEIEERLRWDAMPPIRNAWKAPPSHGGQQATTFTS